MKLSLKSVFSMSSQWSRSFHWNTSWCMVSLLYQYGRKMPSIVQLKSHPASHGLGHTRRRLDSPYLATDSASYTATVAVAVIRSLSTKGTFMISQLTACVKSHCCSSVLSIQVYHPSITGSMVLGWCAHHFRAGAWGLLENTPGNQHPTDHAPWRVEPTQCNIKVLGAQGSPLRTALQGSGPQKSQPPRLHFHTQDTHPESICSEYPN